MICFPLIKKALFGLFFLILTVSSGLSRKESQIDLPECIKYLSQPSYHCTQEYNPICAQNGITYKNECIFCSAMRPDVSILRFKHFGRC
ncbi:ovomucoid-like [Phascolarctos cinereus]|uniref:Serine protease inhibitor Kazal-type 10-like isoform X1 n=1 Tax=Phascolarctos cinereus TaxID=38626 RepID=A0A6P5IRQ6_PHACI|nr:serine protease inhibitor Kazal-type 10-like isoform X1 [Phascolarctos cinereus]